MSKPTARHPIGILTMYSGSRNFGGLLQAYALQKAIATHFAPCEQISYRMSPTPLGQRLRNACAYHSATDIARQLLQQAALHTPAQRRRQKQTDRLLSVRQAHFAAFEQEIPHSETVYDRSTIARCADDYAAFVTGSDQIWSGGIDLEAFCLHFVPDGCPRIAYAASAASTATGTWQRGVFARELNRFAALSTREPSLRDALKPFTQLPIAVMPDPVFLLTPQDWRSLAVPARQSRPYLLCYLLGDSQAHRDAARQLARESGCALVTFPHILYGTFRRCDVGFGDLPDCTAGPREFLGLLDGAQAVVTDSFHATAFSLLLQKPFCVFPRFPAQQKGACNTRIFDLLHRVGLEQNVACDLHGARQALAQPLDHAQAARVLQRLRGDALAWLASALARAQTETTKEPRP